MMKELILRIEKEDFDVLVDRANLKGFKSLDDYFLDVLKQMVLKINGESLEVDEANEDFERSEESYDEAKEVLKDLGYM